MINKKINTKKGEIELRFLEANNSSENTECNAYLNEQFIGGIDFLSEDDLQDDCFLAIQYAMIKPEFRGIGLYKEILTFVSNEMKEDYILSEKRTKEAINFYKKYIEIEAEEEIRIYAGFNLELY